jgi:hypothetical protein
MLARPDFERGEPLVPGRPRLGVVGAILAVPFAAIVKTVLREAGAPRRERMQSLRAP